MNKSNAWCGTVSKQEDWYTRDYAERHARWIVKLNTEERVFQDDKREGLLWSAWKRLKNHCDETGEYITELTIEFRKGNRFHLPGGKDGYFFCNSILGQLGGRTKGYFLIGYLDGEWVRIQKVQVPEMLDEGWETRHHTTRGMDQCLIRKSTSCMVE